MSSKIYLEGGGDSKDLRTRCREGFRKLLESCGFAGKMPRLVACGGRNHAFDDFTTAHSNADEGDYVAMWIDSEDPVEDIEQPWEHLKNRDGWERPDGAEDEQVLFMTTSMETWIACDHPTLREFFGACLQENALPSHVDMEGRTRETVLAALVSATRTCKSPYAKGSKSFELLGRLQPSELRPHLPSFRRCEAVLGGKL